MVRACHPAAERPGTRGTPYASGRSSGSPPGQHYTGRKDVPVWATRHCLTKIVPELPRRGTVQKVELGCQCSQAIQRRPVNSMSSRSNLMFSAHPRQEPPNGVRPKPVVKMLCVTTRNCRKWNVLSAAGRVWISKCGRFLIASKIACGRMCSCACWPTPSSGACAVPWRRFCSTMPIRPPREPYDPPWSRPRNGPYKPSSSQLSHSARRPAHHRAEHCHHGRDQLRDDYDPDSPAAAGPRPAQSFHPHLERPVASRTAVRPANRGVPSHFGILRENALPVRTPSRKGESLHASTRPVGPPRQAPPHHASAAPAVNALSTPAARRRARPRLGFLLSAQPHPPHRRSSRRGVASHRRFGEPRLGRKSLK